MSIRLPSRNEILDLLGTDPRPLHVREIASRLRVSEVDHLGLERLLDSLSLEGVLDARPGARFKLNEPGYSVGPATGGAPSTSTPSQTSGPAAPKPYVPRPRAPTPAERDGLLTVHPRGFGFVAALAPVAPGDDVFIPPDAMGGAVHGDKVRIRVRARSARGAEGEVLSILERGITRVAGTLRRRGKSAWLEPDDTRMRGPIVLPREIDAAGSAGNSGNDGDAIVVALTRWPESPDENPEGRIEQVLGRPGELSVEAAKILVLERVGEPHSDQAVAEAEAFGEEVPEAMKEGRVDLRHLPLPTIDPEDARDHDDAVWVERTPSGGYRAYIAIADVSTYVTPGSAVDEEAKVRGCTVYLPDRALPMLPRALAANLCSLLPNVDRLCLCAQVELDAGANVISTQLLRGVMRSRAKLTYGGVARALGLTEKGREEPAAFEMLAGLKVAYELSKALRARRMERGALDFELPEAKVVLHEETREPIDVARRAADPGERKAYQLIEELMLLGNEVVARWCTEREVPTIFRVHAPPDEQKLERFANMCEQLSIDFDVEDTKDPKKLGDLLKSFKEHPLAPVLNSLLLRSMKQATYDIANVGHFGLASKSYLHFTSPIRRYPDLVVHRVVHQVLRGEARRDDRAREKLGEAAFAASIAERRAMEVERAIVDLYRVFLMKSRIGDRFEGTVTAVVGSGLFVQLDSPFVDVLVRLEDLGHDHWEIDEGALRVIAARSGDVVALGDRLTVEVTDAMILRRTVYARRIREPGQGKGDGAVDGDAVNGAEGAARPGSGGRPSKSHGAGRSADGGKPADGDRNRRARRGGNGPNGPERRDPRPAKAPAKPPSKGRGGKAAAPAKKGGASAAAGGGKGAGWAKGKAAGKGKPKKKARRG